MSEKVRFYDWFIDNWAKASLPLAIVLFLISPFVYKGIGLAAFLVYLTLPFYMLHQYEEHAGGQFKAFVNKTVGRGREVLSDRAIFRVNVLWVWLGTLVVLYLCVYVNIVWGLLSGYLVALNGIVHIVTSIRMRRYNPGLWTSVVVFLPLGIYIIYLISKISGAGLLYNGIFLVVTILLHSMILLNIRRQRRQA
ncbi:MAG: HXXEE domain-containing protein [Dehalococcoidia bacterium]|jgi:hypothetical protein